MPTVNPSVATVPVMSDEAIARYRSATVRYVAAESDVKRYSDARAVAVVDALEAGMTMRQLATELGVTPARIHQLAERGRAVRTGGD